MWVNLQCALKSPFSKLGKPELTQALSIVSSICQQHLNQANPVIVAYHTLSYCQMFDRINKVYRQNLPGRNITAPHRYPQKHYILHGVTAKQPQYPQLSFACIRFSTVQLPILIVPRSICCPIFGYGAFNAFRSSSSQFSRISFGSRSIGRHNIHFIFDQKALGKM